MGTNGTAQAFNGPETSFALPNPDACYRQLVADLRSSGTQGMTFDGREECHLARLDNLNRVHCAPVVKIQVDTIPSEQDKPKIRELVVRSIKEAQRGGIAGKLVADDSWHYDYPTYVKLMNCNTGMHSSAHGPPPAPPSVSGENFGEVFKRILNENPDATMFTEVLPEIVYSAVLGYLYDYPEDSVLTPWHSLAARCQRMSITGYDDVAMNTVFLDVDSSEGPVVDHYSQGVLHCAYSCERGFLAMHRYAHCRRQAWVQGDASSLVRSAAAIVLSGNAGKLYCIKEGAQELERPPETILELQKYLPWGPCAFTLQWGPLQRHIAMQESSDFPELCHTTSGASETYSNVHDNVSVVGNELQFKIERSDARYFGGNTTNPESPSNLPAEYRLAVVAGQSPASLDEAIQTMNPEKRASVHYPGVLVAYKHSIPNWKRKGIRGNRMENHAIEWNDPRRVLILDTEGLWQKCFLPHTPDASDYVSGTILALWYENYAYDAILATIGAKMGVSTRLFSNGLDAYDASVGIEIRRGLFCPTLPRGKLSFWERFSLLDAADPRSSNIVWRRSTLLILVATVTVIYILGFDGIVGATVGQFISGVLFLLSYGLAKSEVVVVRLVARLNGCDAWGWEDKGIFLFLSGLTGPSPVLPASTVVRSIVFALQIAILFLSNCLVRIDSLQPGRTRPFESGRYSSLGLPSDERPRGKGSVFFGLGTDMSFDSEIGAKVCHLNVPLATHKEYMIVLFHNSDNFLVAR
mmetsp:Transcript_18447/g.69806  ORF Transcript_18447/g.69806 Transcript_18447/m.69806 type:complete len:751 (+) Transcript_18447:178-2430(+)